MDLLASLAKADGKLRTLLYNAVTGNPTPAQYKAIIDAAGVDNYRAHAGKVTMEQARAEVKVDIDKIIAMNTADAAAANQFNPLHPENFPVVVAVVGLGALAWLTMRRK